MDVDQRILQTDRQNEREKEKARQIDQWWSGMTSLTFVFIEMPNRSFSINLPFVEINERIISWYGSTRNKMEAYGLRVNVKVDVHRSTSFAWEEREIERRNEFSRSIQSMNDNGKSKWRMIASTWSKDEVGTGWRVRRSTSPWTYTYTYWGESVG